MYLSVWLSACLSVCLSTCLSASLKTLLFYETYLFFQVDNIKNAALLRDVLIFWSWQHQKRSNSARPPHFFWSWPHQKRSNSAKTFSLFFGWQHHKRSTSARLLQFFQLDNIKNKAILRDFLQKWKVECRANSFVPMRVAIASPPVQSTAPATKKWCQVIRSAAPVTQNHLSKPEDPLLQNGNRLRKSAPWPPLMNMSFVLRLPREMHLWRSSSNVPRLPSLLDMLQNPHFLLTFDEVNNPLRLPRESTSERPKVLRTRQFFALLTSKCASRHNGVHFFDISTSKKWSGAGVKCASRHNGVHFFNISTSKVVRTWCILYILTCKCASRHNGVQFFISHLARWLRTRRFSEPTFRPSGATNHWKNTVFRNFPTFSRICIFFLLTLSLLWSVLFYSSLLSASAHLCFSSVHIVGLNFLRIGFLNQFITRGAHIEKRFRIFSVDFPLGRIKNHLRFKPPAASSLTSSRKASTTGLSTEFLAFLKSMEHQIFGEIRWNQVKSGEIPIFLVQVTILAGEIPHFGWWKTLFLNRKSSKLKRDVPHVPCGEACVVHEAKSQSHVPTTTVTSVAVQTWGQLNWDCYTQKMGPRTCPWTLFFWLKTMGF